MPRPKKCRRICALPRCSSFGPLEGAADGRVEMAVEEYEAIRLIDLLGLTQEACARQMDVARTTVQAIYDSARRKLADVLVNGKALTIQGGSYHICGHGQKGCGKGCCHHVCKGNPPDDNN